MEYVEDMKRYEEEKKMAYVTTAERLGIKKGFSQGLEQGLQQGMEQGIEQGMEKKALEIAANMKQAGIDAAIIAETTGLSREMVEKLPQGMGKRNNIKKYFPPGRSIVDMNG